MEIKTELNEIKAAYQLLCSACLSVGRSLHKVNEPKLRQYYLDILDEIPLSKMTIGSFTVCWECKALLEKSIAFKEQVMDCYKLLHRYTYELLIECDLKKVSRPPRLKVHNMDPISVVPEEFNNDDTFVDVPLVSVKDEVENDVESVKVDLPCHLPGTQHCEHCYLAIARGRQGGGTHSAELLHKVFLSVLITEESTAGDCHLFANSDDTPELVSLEPNIKDKKKIKIKNMRRKEKNANKILKRLRINKKRKSTKSNNKTAKKITCIEVSYEEMLVERIEESMRDSYVNAEFKCESCLVGFNYSKTYEAHKAAKHSPELGDYSCPICKTVISSVEAFTAHYKRHLKRYECSICKKRTMDLKVMEQHYYSTHHIALKEYKCNLCGTVSNSIDTHRYHKQSHKARVQCPDCDKTFSHRAGLMNHRLTVHEFQNEFPCSLCDKVFRWKASLKRHLEKHDSKSSSEPAYCVTCGVSFASVCSYQRHLKNSLKHVSPDQLRYICDHCKRRFSDKTKLRDHIEEKHLHKSYQCHICLKPSKNRVGLDQHIRNVHRGRPLDKMCQHCGKGFPTKVQLESHVRSHTGERPFICELCPTSFSQQSNLYKHNRQVHLNIKAKRYPVCKKRKDDPPPPAEPLPPQHPTPAPDYYMYIDKPIANY